MPYALEKGPYFSILESYLNDDRDRAHAGLLALRSGAPMSEIGVLDPPIAGSPYGPDALKLHMNRDWFGLAPTVAASGKVLGWEEQAAFDEHQHPTTGFWRHWYGDAEAIFRETLVRALEVSLGVPRPSGSKGGGRGRPEPPTRHWPIVLLWNCPHPWYEGWVSWRRQERSGQVMVQFNTPAHGAPVDAAGGALHNGELFNSPIRPPGTDPSKLAPYEIDPDEATGTNGLWLVSQTYHLEWTPPTSTAPSPAGTWRPPTLGRPVRSVGEVVTVAIAEIDGGVLPDGRTFVPATP